MTSTPLDTYPDSTPANFRTGLFVLLLAFLNLQADGLRLATDPLRNQIRLLPLTLLFCAILSTLLRPTLPTPSRRLAVLLAHLGSRRTLLNLTRLALLLAWALFTYEAHYYARFGYQLHLWPTAAVFISFALLLTPKLYLDSAPTRILSTVLLAFTAISALSIWSFPLTIARSDMLPLLAAANRTFLTGADPYRIYTFPTETVLLTYLPGTLLAFLPATFLHLDLRLTNLLCTLVLALLVTRAAAPRHRAQLIAVLAIWPLSPYLLYRHEIYTPPHWLTLIAALLLVHRGRVVAGAVLFGVSIALSQFSWILLPFVLLHVYQRFGPRLTLSASAVTLAPPLFLTLPFLLWSPHTFLFGVLSHWGHQSVAARPVNLSFWIATLAGTYALQPAQLVALVAAFGWCIVHQSCRTFTGLLRWSAAALTAFTLLNILVWGYFFLLLELILLLYVASANGWLTPEPAA